jgi:hypothetical protein
VIQLSEQQVIDDIAERLSGAFPTVAPDVVSEVVHEKHARFEGRPLRDYIPLFVERNAKRELAKIGG